MSYNTPMVQFDINGAQYALESKPYECNVCLKRFTQKAHLTTHKRTHTGEKPYACHICHKRFAQSSHLTTHKRTHTGEKPYYCMVCHLGFCRKQRLEQHLQLTHKIDVKCGNYLDGKFGNYPMEGQENPNQDLSLGYQELLPDVRGSISVFPSVTSNSESDFSNDFSGLSGLDGVGHSRRKPSTVNRINKDDLIPSGTSEVHDVESEANSIQGSGMNIKMESTDPAGFEKCQPSSMLCSDGPDTSGEVENGNPTRDRSSSSLSVPGKDDDVDDAACGVSTTEAVNSGSGDEGDGASVTSESNLSGSEQSLSSSANKHSMFPYSQSESNKRLCRQQLRFSGNNAKLPTSSQSHIATNSRICLVNFTNDDLLTHLMSRDDVYKCEYCCVIFQDAAMYHLHRSMHDKMDIRCCNICGKLANDKYDFIAHFLSEHKS